MQSLRRVARKPATAFAALLRQGGDAQADAQPVPLATGRAAFEIGLRALGVTSGAQVLLPSYICDVMLLPLQRMGLSPLFYDLDDSLVPDWVSLEAMLPSAAAAVLFHPFGQPQDSARFGELCLRHHAIFIEDNAHGWGAETGNKPLGTLGDMGFVSPWKQYAVPHGAFLYLKDAAAAQKALQLGEGLPVQRISYGAPLAKALVRNFLTLFPQARLRLMPPAYFPEAAESDPAPPQRMSPAVMRYLARQQATDDAARRRALYQIWEVWTRAAGLLPVFPLIHSAAAPLCFPAYAVAGDNREHWLEWGWLHDIAIHTWPTLPDQLRLRPPIQDRWNRLLCFPIHHEIEPEALRRMLDSLNPPS